MHTSPLPLPQKELLAGISWEIVASVRPKYLKKCMKLNRDFLMGQTVRKIPTMREVSMNIINVLQSNHNIQLSKALSYILRHGATKEGLQMTQGN